MPRPPKMPPAGIDWYFVAVPLSPSDAPSAPAPALAASGERRSPLAKMAVLAWVVVLVYASLLPWRGWRDLGVSPFAYLSEPWPARLIRFDLIVNLLGYLPLGALGVLALYPRRRRLATVVGVTLGGVVLSATMEALQTYLPARVPSIVDLVANSAGTLLGAAGIVRFAPALLDHGRLAELRDRWFLREATAPLLLIAVWPLAQLHPSATLFGNGAWGWLGEHAWRDLAALVVDDPSFELSPAAYAIAEALVVVMALLAVGLTAATRMTRNAPRTGLLLTLLGAALAAKMIAYGVQFGAERVFLWVTPGAVGGLLIGVPVLLVAAGGPRHRQVALALFAALCVWLIVNLIPANPYFQVWQQTWRPGRLRDVTGLAAWIADAWPALLIAWLVYALASRSARRQRAA